MENTLQQQSKKGSSELQAGQKSPQFDIYCDIHKNMKIILICKECIKPLCALCLTEHQSLQHSPGADLYEGIDRLKENNLLFCRFYSQQLVPQELQKNLKKQKQILKQKLNQIEKQKIDNDSKVQGAVEKLKQKVIRLFENKQPELQKLLENENKNTVTAFKKYYELFKAKIKKYKNLYKQFFESEEQSLKQLEDLCSYEKQYQSLDIEQQIKNIIPSLKFDSLPQYLLDQFLSEALSSLLKNKSTKDITCPEKIQQSLDILEEFGKTKEKLSKPDWDFSKILQSPNLKPKKQEQKQKPQVKEIPLEQKDSEDDSKLENEPNEEDFDQDKSSDNSVDNMNQFRQMIKQSIQQRGVGNGLINKEQFVESKKAAPEKEKKAGKARSKKVKLNNESEKTITRKRQTSKMVNASKRGKGSKGNNDSGLQKELQQMKKQGLLD